jgi:hypothetical protein
VRIDLPFTTEGTPAQIQAFDIVAEQPLIFRDQAGRGYYTADSSISKVWYLEVLPPAEQYGPSDRGITIKLLTDSTNTYSVVLTPSFTQRLDPLKSLTYLMNDLGVVQGVTDGLGGTWTASPVLNTAGARAWKWAINLLSNGASSGATALETVDAAFPDGINDIPFFPLTIGASGNAYALAVRNGTENVTQLRGGATTPAVAGFAYPADVFPSENTILTAPSGTWSGPVPTIQNMTFTVLF